MAEPRNVVVTLAGIKSMTILEVARASVIANIKRSETERLLRTLLQKDADPSDLEKAALLLYAWAFQITKRDEPNLTWEDAQTWRVTFDLDITDPMQEAESEARIAAAVATGLPPAIAEQLTIADMGAYAEIAKVK